MRLCNIWIKTLRFLALHSLVTLVSLPILVMWGLPLSVLSPIGNLVFAPALTCSLLASSLLFFMQLFYIPYTVPRLVFSTVSRCWQTIPPYNLCPLIGIPRCPWQMLILISIATLFCLHLRYSQTPPRRAFLLTTTLICLIAILRYTAERRPDIMPIAFNGTHVYLVLIKDNCILIDTGALGKQKSSVSWAGHELIQEIVKLTGKTSIDHIITLQPNHFTFEALIALHEKFRVKQTYIPIWQGHLKLSVYNAFRRLRKIIIEQERNLTRINHTTSHAIKNTLIFSLNNIGKTITHGNTTYPVIELLCFVDSNVSRFYPAKYKKNPLLNGRKEDT